MSTQRWLALQTTEDHRRFTLPLDARVLTHAGALHGARAWRRRSNAAEAARPAGRWCGPPRSTSGTPARRASPTWRSSSSWTATTRRRPRATIRVDGIDVLSAFTAHGRRDRGSGVWGTPPVVPPPAQSAAWPMPSAGASLLDHFDVRQASGRTAADVDGTPGDGSTALWCRCPACRGLLTRSTPRSSVTSVMLALSDALGFPTTANSLDNTIRIVARPTTDWVLVDVSVDAAVHGFGHVRARLSATTARSWHSPRSTRAARRRADGRSTRSTRRIVGWPDR